MAARGKRRSTQKIEKGDDEAKKEQSRKISRKVVDKEVIELSSSLRGSTMHDQRLHVNFNGGASKEIGDDFDKTTVVEPSLKEVVTQMSTMMNTLTNLIASQTKTCYPVFGTMPQTINLRNGPADNFNPTLMPVIMSGFSMPSGSLERNLDSSKKIRSNMSSIHQAADSKSHMATKCCSMSPKCEQTPPDDYVIRRSLFSDDCTRKKTATEPVITSSLDKAVYVSYFNPADRKLPLANETAKIPAWKPVLFRPPADMALCKDEVSVVTYVFGSDMEDEELNSEIISQTNLWHANRRVMYTLLPNKPLVDEQFALNWTHSPKTLKRYYVEEYMGEFESLCKIFVPMNEDNMHWYLVVIDIEKRHLILLDSKPCVSSRTRRRRCAKLMALFIEEMLDDSTFYANQTTHRPVISEYPIIHPTEIGEQNDDSNDCGVWVTTWMRECQWRSNYNIKVNDSTRLRLAIDLVMNSFNLKSQEVLEAAKKYYNEISKKEERLVKGLGSML
ncbi:Ulp1 protease family, carboxy-terminal domain protein [Arachis hypogaea]|nr:Ulp1 protease family, carboxy-terminal domain protein [Arachis hypogaea]